MVRFLIAATLLIAARHDIPAVPIDVPLWRLEGKWVYPPKEVGDLGRTAPAVILEFRSSGEFVEHHCWVIDNRDNSVMISGGDPHVVIVGTWKVEGSEIVAHRSRIARTVPIVGGADPVCSKPVLRFNIFKKTVEGDIGEGGFGRYTAVKHLVSPDFDAYVSEARQSSVVCGGTVNHSSQPPH